jgi:hypothetical protein
MLNIAASLVIWKAIQILTLFIIIVHDVIFYEKTMLSLYGAIYQGEDRGVCITDLMRIVVPCFSNYFTLVSYNPCFILN